MQENIVMFPHPSPDEESRLPRHHLPTPLTLLIGREQDAAAACALLQRPEGREGSEKRAWRCRSRQISRVALSMESSLSRWSHYVTLIWFCLPSLRRSDSPKREIGRCWSACMRFCVRSICCSYSITSIRWRQRLHNCQNCSYPALASSCLSP